MLLGRRSFLFGLGATIAAPAIVPYTNLMPLPRVPYIQTPSGLWVKAVDTLTGKERLFSAVAKGGTAAQLMFKCDDAMFSFDKLTIGRDEHDLLYANQQQRRTVCVGDSVVIALTLNRIIEQEHLDWCKESALEYVDKV